MSKTPEQLALEYPQMKADIDLCYEQLSELCRHLWLKEERKKAIMCLPHQKTDFDMQFSAAFDELKAYRENQNLVEVVRCKDCEFPASRVFKGKDELYCSICDGIVSPNGYCSEGARRSEGNLGQEDNA